MSKQNLSVGYVLGEALPTGHVELDWIGSVYETRDAAEVALAEAYTLGASHLNIYELHSLKPLEFGRPAQS